ncbi:hypothetical protein P692DRAFT_20914760, partial [Suillus brevipes Sb2]
CLHGPTTLLIVGLANLKIYRKRPFKFLAVFPVHTQRPSGYCPARRRVQLSNKMLDLADPGGRCQSADS